MAEKTEKTEEAGDFNPPKPRTGSPKVHSNVFTLSFFSLIFPDWLKIEAYWLLIFARLRVLIQSDQFLPVKACFFTLTLTDSLQGGLFSP